MRNGARPRRRSPVAAPGMSQSSERLVPEARPLEPIPLPDQTAVPPNDDVVELLVRVPIEALEDEPTGEPGLDGAAAHARGAAGTDRPSAAVTGGGSEPGRLPRARGECGGRDEEEAVSARPAAVAPAARRP